MLPIPRLLRIARAAQEVFNRFQTDIDTILLGVEVERNGYFGRDRPSNMSGPVADAWCQRREREMAEGKAVVVRMLKGYETAHRGEIVAMLPADKDMLEFSGYVQDVTEAEVDEWTDKYKRRRRKRIAGVRELQRARLIHGR